MARRSKVKIGKISTGGWIAIAGAGLVGVYLVTRPKTSVPTYGTTYPPGYYPPSTVPPNNTASTIATDITSIFNSIFN